FLGAVTLVDQSILGKTPRSNPAVYVGAFDDIREFFAQSEPAQQRGLNASAFSFNSGQGQCERCRGAGFEKIEMQFLSDVFIRCPECNGRRYRPHILQVKISPKSKIGRGSRVEEPGSGGMRSDTRHSTLDTRSLQHETRNTEHEARRAQPSPQSSTLFLFDEPTTGLHFDDVRVVLKVFQRLVDAGHSVLVIEHNLDVIKSADWVIDLGPEAGDQGGYLVAQGTPEEIALCHASHTGISLREVLTNRQPDTPRHVAPDGLIIPEKAAPGERIAEREAP